MQCRFYVVVWQSWGLVCKQAAWWWKRLCSGALAFTGDVLRWSTSFHDPFFSAPGPSAILAHTHNTDFLHSNPCYLKALISTFQPAGLQGLFEGGGCCTLASRSQWPTSCFPSVVRKNHMIPLMYTWVPKQLHLCLLISVKPYHLHCHTDDACRHWGCVRNTVVMHCGLKSGQCLVWAEYDRSNLVCFVQSFLPQMKAISCFQKMTMNYDKETAIFQFISTRHQK